jgi:adenylosuccinate lyase
MRENLELTHGLVYSGQLLLALVERGVPREDGYRWVQRNAMRVWDEGISFREGVLADPDIMGRMDAASVARVFDSGDLLENIDGIFERVFGTGAV